MEFHSNHFSIFLYLTEKFLLQKIREVFTFNNVLTEITLDFCIPVFLKESKIRWQNVNRDQTVI
jgi:hypothetical protein